MIVRCPQCQFANQAETDTTKPRIICARCATVITLEPLGQSVAPVTDLPVADLFDDGGPQAEPVFMKTPDSPLDLDSLLSPADEVAPDQPLAPISSFTPSEFAMPVESQFAPPLENRWEADEILDIPRNSASIAQGSGSPLAVEDLFSEPLTDFAESEFAYADNAVYAESPPDGLQADLLQEDILEPLPPYTEVEDTDEMILEDLADGAASYAQAGVSPVELPASESVNPSPVFAQDSYVRSPRNTFVMAEPPVGNKSRLARGFLVAAVLFALLGVGYFALSGLVKSWLSSRNSQVATAADTAGQTAAGTSANNKSATAPTVVPSLAAATTGEKAVTATSSASPATNPSTSPVAAATSTAPTGNLNSAGTPPAATTSNVTPTPVTAKTGSSGHSVSQGEGSLTIQVASFKSASEAQQFAARLKTSGNEARVVKAEVAGKGTWYRVQSGRFTSEAEASKYASELRAKGVAQDFIVTGYQNP